MLIQHFGAETHGFQRLVDQNDRGKALVPEKSHLQKLWSHSDHGQSISPHFHTHIVLNTLILQGVHPVLLEAVLQVTMPLASFSSTAVLVNSSPSANTHIIAYDSFIPFQNVCSSVHTLRFLLKWLNINLASVSEKERIVDKFQN